MAFILKPTSENIALCAKTLMSESGVVGMPTETVYGLAANAFDVQAVDLIFKTKGRPASDPLILHVSGFDMLMGLQIIDESCFKSGIETIIKNLATRFWPGPLTLILPKSKKVPDNVTSGLSTVAVRVPAHKDALSLIEACNTALAAPSANRFGRISPTTAMAVDEELGNKIRYILDGGACAIGVESTVLKITDSALTILRPGKITPEEIENATGIRPVMSTIIAPQGQLSESPGQLASHYAPEKNLCLLPFDFHQCDLHSILSHDFLEKIKSASVKQIGLCIVGAKMNEKKSHLENFFKASNIILSEIFLWNLSRTISADEISRNLFSTLRQMDKSGAQILFCEQMPELSNQNGSFMLAINDRLKRASTH